MLNRKALSWELPIWCRLTTSYDQFLVGLVGRSVGSFRKTCRRGGGRGISSSIFCSNLCDRYVLVAAIRLERMLRRDFTKCTLHVQTQRHLPFSLSLLLTLGLSKDIQLLYFLLSNFPCSKIPCWLTRIAVGIQLIVFFSPFITPLPW